jgi:hypothetical protein
MIGAALGGISGWSATSLPQNNARAGWVCIGCGILFSFLFLITFGDIQKFDLSFWLVTRGLPLLWSLLLIVRGIYLVRQPDKEVFTDE